MDEYRKEESDDEIKPSPKRYKKNASKVEFMYECQRPTPLVCVNQALVDALVQVRDGREVDAEHRSALSYSRAIASIRAYPVTIVTLQQAAEAASNIPNVGAKVEGMIKEFVQKGSISEAIRYQIDPQFQVLQKFMKIFGCGSSTAQQWYVKGYRSFEDLLDANRKGKLTLSANQKFWLEHSDDMQKKIPREEAKAIRDTIESEVKEVEPTATSQIVGSFRRGKPSVGDLDVLFLVDGKKPSDVLQEVIQVLRSKNQLKHVFAAMNHDFFSYDSSTYGREEDHLAKCFIMFQRTPETLWHQVDIIICGSKERYPFALLGWTGSRQFERSIRKWASDKFKYHLNSYGLYDRNGQFIPADSEEHIFKMLGLEYRKPEERNC